MTAHARLSPSSAARWLACPGSVALCDKVPEQPASEEAAEGIVFHRVAAECLELGLEPADFIGQRLTADGHTFIFDEEMAGHMQPGLDRIRELADGPMFVEQTVKLDPWLPGQFGTLDCGIVGHKEIIIFDWKYGAGVPVSPVENPQLMLYALGFHETIAYPYVTSNPVRLVIEQPRAPGGGEWVVSGLDLGAFGEKVREVGKIIDSPDAPLVPGEKQCRFCPARSICPAFAKFNLDLFSMKFEDLDAETPPDLPEITPERRSYVVRHADMFRKWLDDLHAETLADALAGRPTPGLKVVHGRKPNREWADEEQATSFLTRYLGDSAFIKKLRSPAQAEKVLDKDVWRTPVLSMLISQGDPKPVLVPETDSRQAIEPLTAKFDDLTMEEVDG